jgi:ATP-dependent Clp protease ATP-binding subunit ClpB
MDFSKFTDKSQEAIQKAQQLAENQKHPAIENAHILQGIFQVDKDVIPYLLGKLNINTKMVEAALDKIIQSFPTVTGGQLYLSKSANSV